MKAQRETSAYAQEHWPCPLGRTFPKPHMTCIGSTCPLWRWSTNGPWKAAVQAEAKRIDDKVPFAKASAAVAANPDEHGLHGYCGLGGAL